MAAVTVRITWRSGQDGRRHAVEGLPRHGRVRYGLCGAVLEPERLDRPDQAKHQVCVSLVDAQSHETESELRFAFGDR